MSRVADRLRLYGRAAPERKPARPASQEISFAEFVFQRSGPVLVRSTSRKTMKTGIRNLEDYYPMAFSGILELAMVDRPEAVHPEDVIFLDTETTGLSRGPGNFPFLTGMAWFRGDTLHFEQVFLEDLSAESAYLDRIFELLAGFRYLVTFNGKAFDIPLLKNRLVLNRMRRGVPLTHFDLLHIFRRLLPKPSVDSYRQQEMEAHLLGSVRHGDIDGSAIPQIYFDYSKYGEKEALADVISHNERDLAGMVFLFLEAVRLYETRDASRSATRSGIARILAGNNRRQEALGLLAAVENGRADDFRYRDLLFLAALLRKEKRIDDAVRVYGRTAREYGCQFSHICLAKIFEHQLRDIDSALKHTRQALVKKKGPFSEEDLQRRLARLEMKKARGRVR